MGNPFSRHTTQWQVYFNGAKQRFWRVQSCVQTVGGKRLDNAVLEGDLGAEGGHIKSFLLQGQRNKDLEVEVTQKINGGAEIVRHWGKAARETLVITPSGERVTFTSRLERHHFGRPLDGIEVWNPLEKLVTEIDHDLVFNPEIDGKTFGNMHPKIFKKLAGSRLFLSPDSTRTAVAAKLHGGTPVHWVLSAAVHYLCSILNEDQKYITNPDLQELSNIFDDNADRIDNVRMPHMRPLPELLDKLLNPLGYGWYIALPRLGVRTFQFYRYGFSSRAITLKHLAVGKVYKRSQHDVEALNLTLDNGRLVNVLHGRGSAVRAEFTAELHRGWDPAHDDKDHDSLRTTVGEFEDVKDVYRKWVLNEAGDYDGKRPGIKRFDLTKVFTEPLAGRIKKQWNRNPKETPRRRPLLPCLTLDTSGNPIGQSQGILVEYSNPAYDSTDEGADAEPEWLRIGSWGAQPLRREAGIYFSGAVPPKEMWRQGTSLRVRITATIESDFRLQIDEDRNPLSLNGDDVIKVLNMEDRFHLRYISKLSQFFGAANDNLADDDTKLMSDYLKRLRETMDAAEIGGTVILEGLDHTKISLGTQVSAIEGRDISLGAGPGGVGHFPQIVAIEWKRQAEQTVVHLERFREAVPPPGRFTSGKL